MSNGPNDARRAPDPAWTERLRQHDGTGWIDHHRDSIPQVEAASPVESKKRIGRRTSGVAFVVVLIVLGVTVAVAVAGAGEETKEPATDATSISASPTTGAPAQYAWPPTEPTAPESKGFTLQSLDVRNQSGSFSGVAQIVDTEGGRTATFTVTFFAGDEIAGSMSAVVSDMPVDQALTVEFFSADPYLAFDRYAFQTGREF